MSGDVPVEGMDDDDRRDEDGLRPRVAIVSGSFRAGSGCYCAGRRPLPIEVVIACSKDDTAADIRRHMARRPWDRFVVVSVRFEAWSGRELGVQPTTPASSPGPG